MTTVYNCGFSLDHKPTFHIARQYGCDEYWLIYAYNKSLWIIDKKTYHVEPKTIVILDKHTPHELFADDEVYNDGFIMFDTTDPLPLELLNTPIHIGNSVNCHAYLSLLTETFYSRKSKRVHSKLTQAFIADISDVVSNTEKQSRYYADFSRLRTEIYTRPGDDWSIKAMTGRLLLSPSHFQTLYKSFFGVSPAADVINARIDAAKDMLIDNYDCSIDEIAAACGYNSTVHFSRQFKQYVGVSPYKYRKTK